MMVCEQIRVNPAPRANNKVTGCGLGNTVIAVVHCCQGEILAFAELSGILGTE